MEADDSQILSSPNTPTYPELSFIERDDIHNIDSFVDEDFPKAILQSIVNGQNGLSLLRLIEVGKPIHSYTYLFNYLDSSYSDRPVTFSLFCDRAYSSVLNVEAVVVIDSSGDAKAVDFAHRVNNQDLLHQIWYDKYNHIMHVRRQYSVAPSLSTIDGFIKFLKELRDYTNQLSKLDSECLNAEQWKTFAITPKVGVSTAEQILFDQEHKTLLWLGGAMQDMNDDGTRVSPMTSEVFGPKPGSVVMGIVARSYDYGLLTESNPIISTYAFAPYMAKVSGRVQIDSGSLAERDQDSIQDFCDEWNSSGHFTLSWLDWHSEADGSIVFEITMSCLLAERRNPETVYRILGSYAQTVLSIHKHFDKEVSKEEVSNKGEEEPIVTTFMGALIVTGALILLFAIGYLMITLSESVLFKIGGIGAMVLSIYLLFSSWLGYIKYKKGGVSK
ncbi:MAG: hypothetical protein IJ724_03330 [Muribaculaceae bacterium]|nr:hypothetical protein [Muribaculaceae bacterium]